MRIDIEIETDSYNASVESYLDSTLLMWNVIPTAGPPHREGYVDHRPDVCIRLCRIARPLNSMAWERMRASPGKADPRNSATSHRADLDNIPLAAASHKHPHYI